MRTVYVPSALATMIALHADNLGVRGEEGWLSCSGANLLNWNSAGHQFREAMKRSGLTGYTLHTLRHHYASAVIADGLTSSPSNEHLVTPLRPSP
jgi:integrase